MNVLKNTQKRCSWVSDDRSMIKYHDKEWGVPIHNDKKLFEFLILEVAQAGLSWQTVLNKRENYRRAFDDFDPIKISLYNNKDVERLMNDAGIIRNKLKILSTILNAKSFLKIKKDFGTFHKYIWQFVDGRPIKNKFKSLKEIPSTTKESDAMSKDLKKRGFKFIGSTMCYAFMQGVGMVNDHETSCKIRIRA